MSLLDLDDAKIGTAVKRAMLTAKQLGHDDVRGTVRDYLLPHLDATTEPELAFAWRALLGDVDGTVSEADQIAVGRADDWHDE